MKFKVFIIILLIFSFGSSDAQTLKEIVDRANVKFDESDYNATYDICKDGIAKFTQQSHDSLYIELLRTASLSTDYLGYYDICQEFNHKLLEIQTARKDTDGIASALNDISIIHYYKENYDIGLKYAEKALEMYRVGHDSIGISMCYNNMANCYSDAGDLKKGLKYYNLSLEMNKRLYDYQGVAICLSNLGETLYAMEEFEDALPHFEDAIEVCNKHELGEWYVLSPYLGISQLYLQLNKPLECLKYADISLKIAKKLNFRAETSTAYATLADIYEAIGNHEEALSYFRKHKDLEDSIYRDENVNRISELNAKYELSEKDSEIKLQQSKLEKEKEVSERNRYLLLVMLIAVFSILVALFFIIRENKKRRKVNKLLNEKNDVIEEKNLSITESILYARKIQNAILPKTEHIQTSFPNSFILYQPKDIVSGDFYWFEKIKNISILAVVDCTGHGVPGAFMSMMAANLLNQVILDENVVHPAQSFELLDQRLKYNLKQNEGSAEGRDGFDISMIAYYHDTNRIKFSGAKNDLYLVRNKELSIYKSNRYSIGGTVDNKIFKGEDFYVEKGDCLYMFTDGFSDQFGGEKDKKFSYKRLRNLLIDISDLDIQIQKDKLEKALEEWKGDNEQLDDICVIGIKF